MPWLLAPALALAVLAAHFYRAGSAAMVAVCVGLIALLALRRAWVPRVVQVGLWLGCVEWVWTAVQIAQQRIAFERPWLRMALILAAVALATAAASAVFRRAALRERYAAPASDQ